MTDEEREMLEAFEEQSNEILNFPERFLKKERSFRVGFESEISIIKEGTNFIQLEGLRNSIIQDVPAITGIELGANQIEVRTPPIDIIPEGFDGLTELYTNCWNAAKRAIHQRGVSILRMGSNPFLPVQNPPRTALERYQKVPDFHREHQRNDRSIFIEGKEKRIYVDDPAIVSLFSSFQINLEAKSFEDAVDKMNRALMIGPFMVAVSGNARYLEMQDSGMQDVRMFAWEKSHDTRTPEDLRNGRRLRVGLPERYFLNLEDYLNRTKSFPFIIYCPETALQIGIGLHWIDARVKFIDNSAVVEFRPVSTQPTIEEELGITLFFLGRLLDSQARNEDLLPIHMVEENRNQAMFEGLHSVLWFLSDENKIYKGQAREVVGMEIQKAIRGLRSLGLEKTIYLDLIIERLRTGSPSDKLSNLINRQQLKNCENFTEALKTTKMLI